MIGCFLILTGCKTQTGNPIIATSSPLKYVSETKQSGITPSPTLKLHTETPVATPPITSSPTLRPTARPTTTVLPTLSLSDAQMLVIGLLQDNGGCSFPCWFGFTPGISSFSETREFVASFAGYFQKNSSKSITFQFPDLPEYENSKRLRGGLVGEKNDGLSVIAFDSPIGYYSLAKILSTYGPPDEVRIRAEGLYMALSEYGTYWIVLYYKEKGIMVEYEGATDKGEKLPICFSPQRLRNYTRILLWDPNLAYSFKEAGKLLGLYTRPESRIETDYKELSEVSDLDIQTFYDRYKVEENRDECFLVPDRKE